MIHLWIINKRVAFFNDVACFVTANRPRPRTSPMDIARLFIFKRVLVLSTMYPVYFRQILVLFTMHPYYVRQPQTGVSLILVSIGGSSILFQADYTYTLVSFQAGDQFVGQRIRLPRPAGCVLNQETSNVLAKGLCFQTYVSNERRMTVYLNSVPRYSSGLCSLEQKHLANIFPDPRHYFSWTLTTISSSKLTPKQSI